MAIHSAKKAQIALLVIQEVKNPSKYSDFQMFSWKKRLWSYQRDSS